MNTNTRAHYTNADQCHSSTARCPLLRPYGVIMPSTTTSQPSPQPSPQPDYDAAARAFRMMAEMEASTDEPAADEPPTSQPSPKSSRIAWMARIAQEQARTAFIQNATPEAHCRTLAACYREALNNPEARLPATPALINSARAWLMEQYAAMVALGFWPSFLNGPQPLEKALAAFEQPAADGEPCRLVPISCDNNGPHPVWAPIENLLFRFVHDHAHHVIGAPATFAGELAVARHTLTPAVRADEPLARFLASESVGQVALSIVSGTYPAQVIAAGILEMI
jgi:hypothetical protein